MVDSIDGVKKGDRGRNTDDPCHRGGSLVDGDDTEEDP